MSGEYPLEKLSKKAIVVKESNYFDTHLVSVPKDSEKYLEKIILYQGQILDRTQRIAKDIIDSNGNAKKELHFLIIMKSSLMFANNLQKYIMEYKKFTETCIYYYHYVYVSSYEDDKFTGTVKIRSDEKIFNSLKDKDVVIVEDMYDTGTTMDNIIKYVKTFDIKSLQICCLFQKQNVKNLKYELDIDFIGFIMPKNTFIVGFGMDFNEIFRDLDHSCLLSKEGYKMLTGKDM